MTAVHSPSSVGHSSLTRPGLLVTLYLVLLGGATGTLTGSVIGVVAIAVFGLAWGAVLTLVATWLSRAQPRKRAWAVAILLVCFLLIGLQASSLTDDPTFRVAILAAIVAGGIVLALAGIWLSRTQPPRQSWATATLLLSALVLGLVSGSSFLGQLLFSTALADAPEVFTAMVRGSLGDAEAVPFFLLNTPLEWLLIPLLVLLTWQVPAQRRLLLAVLAIWGVMRMWTYLYFAPAIFDWGEGSDPLTPGQLDQATLWVGLSWIRHACDILTLALVLLAAVAHHHANADDLRPAGQPAG